MNKEKKEIKLNLSEQVDLLIAINMTISELKNTEIIQDLNKLNNLKNRLIKVRNMILEKGDEKYKKCTLTF